MRITSTRSVTAGFLLTGLALFALSGRLAAHTDGVSGRYQFATGCSCHGTTPNENGALVVDVLGPTALAPGATGHFTLTVTGGPAGTTGGLDLHATGGTLVPGAGTYLASGEIVQSDNTRRTWSFDWQAPMTEGTYNFHSIAMASNNDDGTDGDSWNWFGGAAGTPFGILVSPAVDVDPSPLRFELQAPFPNPSQGSGRATFTLPRDTRVDLEMLDARGRRVAVLIASDLQAGPHTVLWDARAMLGSATPGGVYWIRLSVDGRVLTRRWTLIR